jgi:hypothetical protein
MPGRRRTGPGSILLRVDDSHVIALAPSQARQLVDVLWDVAATTRGAVVAIGKIEHGLTEQGEGEVELAPAEAAAVRFALGEPADAVPALRRIRAQAG